jgi:hypothetical protein
MHGDTLARMNRVYRYDVANPDRPCPHCVSPSDSLFGGRRRAGRGVHQTFGATPAVKWSVSRSLKARSTTSQHIEFPETLRLRLILSGKHETLRRLVRSPAHADRMSDNLSSIERLSSAGQPFIRWPRRSCRSTALRHSLNPPSGVPTLRAHAPAQPSRSRSSPCGTRSRPAPSATSEPRHRTDQPHARRYGIGFGAMVGPTGGPWQ